MKKKYSIVLDEVTRAEIVHVSTKELLITSYGNKIKIKDVQKSLDITLPTNPLLWIFYKFRLSRRFLRLDKMNVFLSCVAKREVVILYRSIVYLYSESTGLEKIDHIESGRNVLHNSATVTPTNRLIFGEYFENVKRGPVNVYSLDLKSKQFDIVHTFDAGFVKHVHACYWDYFSEKIWIFTGDSDGECKVILTDENFTSLDVLGDGSQKWRAISAFFTQDAVYWMMDSPLDTSRLIKYIRAEDRIEILQEFPGPIYYSVSFADGGHLIASTYEPGPSVLGNTAVIFYSDDLENWQEIAKFQHDGLSLKLLKYGIIGFGAGQQAKDDFYIFGEALDGMDGKSFRCQLKLNLSDASLS